MLRAKLLAATAVVSLMAAPAFAQDMTAPATTTPAPATMPQTDPAMPAMPQTPAPTAEAAATTTTTAEATTPVAGETVVDKLKESGQFTTLRLAPTSFAGICAICRTTMTSCAAWSKLK